MGGCAELAGGLLEELAARDPGLAGGEGARRLLTQVENSVEKTARYAEHHLGSESSLLGLKGDELFRAAEGSLVYGHPFHPTPKSSEGFSAEDLGRYAPELGASFRLRYFAAAPEIMAEAFVDGSDKGLVVSHAVLAEARRMLSPARRGYRLIPCHPWQADYLLGWPEVRELLDAGLLVHLGELGERAYPTSSVRTVWSPGHAYSFKLPLNVRITNFVRVNPEDQLDRALDVGRVLGPLREGLPYPDFEVLLEAGYRTISPPSAPAGSRLRLAESFATVFRENPAATGETPVVVASLLEESPGGKVPPLLEALEMAADSRGETLSPFLCERWLGRYLEVSLVPLLKLFLEHGIGAEAHVQNSMVALRSGWPARFYVRDLEGISISRERAGRSGMFGGRLPEDSPALYPDREAWKRLKYYFFVNHLGHLVRTLALYSGRDEASLWGVVARVLREAGPIDAPDGEAFVWELLEGRTLPAKANLISRLGDRGERPVYVPVANPLAGHGVIA